jgi:hypothetical protein
MKTMWRLLLALLIPGCVHAQLIPPPFLIDGKNVVTGDSMNSAFGPRDIGNTPGSRFHEGIDTAPGGLGGVISATTGGKINQILRRNHGTGNAMYIQNNADEFGYWHLFSNAPWTRDVQLNGMILGSYTYIFQQPPFPPDFLACDVIWDTKDRRVLMDPSCPPRHGQLVRGPASAEYRVVKSVSAGTRMGVKGNSGAQGLAPHLHLALRTKEGLKNPLSRIQHDAPSYRAHFVESATSSTPLSSLSLPSSDLPKGAWVVVDFGVGYDLDEVAFAVTGDTSAAWRYRLGGRLGEGPLPADIRNIIYLGLQIPPVGTPAIYARESGFRKKELAFWVKLPEGLAPGTYRLEVSMKPVQGDVQRASLPFSVARSSEPPIQDVCETSSLLNTYFVDGVETQLRKVCSCTWNMNCYSDPWSGLYIPCCQCVGTERCREVVVQEYDCVTKTPTGMRRQLPYDEDIGVIEIVEEVEACNATCVTRFGLEVVRSVDRQTCYKFERTYQRIRVR